MRKRMLSAVGGVILLAGSYAEAGQSTYVLERFAGGQWREIAAPPFRLTQIVGNNQNGVLGLGGGGGRQVVYLSKYDSGSWGVLPPAPFPVSGVAGDNQHGVLVFNGRRVAYIDDYRSAQWRELPAAPFNIALLSGDNAHGPVIVGSDRRSVAHLDQYDRPMWQRATPSPIPVQLFCGDNQSGVAVIGGGRLAVLNRYAGTWQLYAAPPSGAAAVCGDNRKGLVALLGNGRVAVISRYDQGWRILAQRVPVAAAGALLAGDNDAGIIVVGTGRAAPPPLPLPLPPPLPPVVEVDRQAPSVAIVNVRDGFMCKTNSLVVDVRASDNRRLAGVSVNGVQAQRAGRGLFRAKVQLRPGQNRITAQAWDQAGNRSNSSVRVSADWQPPRISAKAQATVTVRGRVDDPSAQVTIDGQPIRVGRDGSFSVQVAAPRSGYVVVTATDSAGNQTRQQIPVQ